ncbi:helix-turn-helix domain-containing protein [Phenylobacterium sp. LH3H17]|uniref:helix-turn-helix domain-containing protein n=1 Tax=Phenylobacterium sp. LH3H17 TaxID=2903901 RepID=UPI0020C98B46|nr:helix-turn-helix transcriptional regulator [Phenylobacterium sp. LH3H17]UTP40515.1 helix-turn-helix domain-containing protein [Phenylobacterium sp. LH3H17]
MRDSIDLHLAKRLFNRRRELNLTQRQLGQLCGVTFQQVQKYECGANRISASMIWRLADALEVPVHYFYDGLEKPHQNGADLADRASPEAKTSSLSLRGKTATSG